MALEGSNCQHSISLSISKQNEVHQPGVIRSYTLAFFHTHHSRVPSRLPIPRRLSSHFIFAVSQVFHLLAKKSIGMNNRRT